MPQYILLRGARQLLTLRGPAGVRRGAALQDLSIIEDGSVLIRDNVIDAIGSTRRLENLKESRNAIEIAAQGKIIMPGFIDAGLHLDAGANDSKRKRLTDLENDAAALLRSCLQHGTLTADVKANGNGGGTRSDLPVLRTLAGLVNPPVDVVSTWRIHQTAPPEDVVRDLETGIQAVRDRKLAEAIEFALPSGERLDPALSAAARAAGLPVKLQWPGGPADQLAAVLADSGATSVGCSSTLSEEESAVLADCPAVVELAPGREITHERRTDGALRLAATGAALALSSGYDSASAPVYSMQMAIALAVLRLGLPVEAAIVAATINAAHSVGRARSVGSIEYGKLADILLLDMPDYRELPRRFGSNHVLIAIRGGRIVLNRSRWKIGSGDLPAR